MRRFIFVIMGLVIVFGSMHLLRDTLRPPAHAELDLHNINAELSRAELQERLAGIEFNCSDDNRLGYGEQACFAPVTQVDGLKAKYLALFFSEDDTLSAVNIVTDPEDHDSSIAYLEEHFGKSNFKKILDEDKWLVWRRDDKSGGILMAHHDDSDNRAPAVMWFRDVELAERLLAP
ncbi:hypothetical protein [Halorhodospira halochloris]|uniref:hypothetical protein n=1 Tax=Halorhodospira halochloris TaxID=1052 RepID=UPI001EE7DC2E|nr:hypothetical protein [Halorhodospira halochloris]MCG5548622.1 hypothetical protein [Halorhodospira halochloris]